MNKCPRRGGGGPQAGTKRTHTSGRGPGAGGPDSGCWRLPPSLPEPQFPNFYKQDWCGLAHVTHTPLTACSLGLLGWGGGAGLLSWERPPRPAHTSPLRSAGPAPETGTRAVQYSGPSGSGRCTFLCFHQKPSIMPLCFQADASSLRLPQLPALPLWGE